MATKITIDNLDSTVKKILEEYEGEVDSNMAQITKRVGDAGVKALKNESKSTFDGNKYWKGWKATTEQNRLYTKVIIHNAKLPGLPHLLEFGHAKVGGGRVKGRVHISKVESELIRAYESEVLRKL